MNYTVEGPGTYLGVLTASCLIDYVAPLVIIQPWLDPFAHFLNGLKCDNAPELASSLSQIFSYFLSTISSKRYMALCEANMGGEISVCVNKFGANC